MLADSVHTRLARLCVTDKGRPSRLAFHDHGARAAILVDLCLARRIDVSERRMRLDTLPTGSEPADKMLTWLTRHRDATIGEIIARGPGRAIDGLLTEASPGTRVVRSRFLRVPAKSTALEHKAIVEAVTTPGPISPQLAALASLASALRLTDATGPETRLARCGPTQDIVSAAVAYLDQLRVKFDYIVAIGRTPGTPGAGGS